MRPIWWLHISDIHLRAGDTWSQDVVLTALCDQIELQRKEGMEIDFILITGDIAFSGNAEEYASAELFLDALSTAADVPKERIFCIPGNHDIDRDRQKLCFRGARDYLQDQSRIDSFLGDGEDLKTLLLRQENYRRFQNLYFHNQHRLWTDDGLCYIAPLTIEDVRLAIVGLDSAWLSEGGVEDRGKLLIGERQVIEAINLAQQSDEPPDIIVCMAHHPFHLLQEFDHQLVQDRIERACHFFHCGHLHNPEVRTTAYRGEGCLTLAAGASYDTRQTHNTYSIVSLDLMNALRTVSTIQYNPGKSIFSFSSTEDYRIEVTPSEICRIDELAQTMKTCYPALSLWSHYLSALLLDLKAEFPIPAQDGHTFGSFAVLQIQSDIELIRKTTNFLAFKNVLRVFYRRIPLAEIFSQHGEPVLQYGNALREHCNTDAELESRLVKYEIDAQMLVGAEPQESFAHIDALLTDLAKSQNWTLLRESAQRYRNLSDPAVITKTKRMLALSLGHSEDIADKKVAIEYYHSLIEGESAEISDAGNLATLLAGVGEIDEAKTVVLDGIRKYPAYQIEYFSQIGQNIVAATGDRGFRKQIESAILKRGERD